MDAASRYTVSWNYDRRLYRHDVAGSIAHARMLARQGIIAPDEAAAIVDGLGRVEREIERGEFPWRDEFEDVHMNIERRLHELIGPVAGKLHTARSRNDQVSTDTRLYVKGVVGDTLAALRELRLAFVNAGAGNIGVVMPGYTHLQRAQPVLFAHHMLAYFEMFGRDARRFRLAREAADVMPLGSGALAGTPHPIDRESAARELGFGAVSANSMDAVSDRDFLLDFHSAASISAMHISRLAEELALWASDEFGFIRLDDRYTTGSSIMPQKRNPDFAELARGKTGRVYGALFALLTTMKGLPLTYNRDMQEDKEGLFDTVDALIPTLRIAAGMVSTMHVRADRMREAAENSAALATDLADHLVSKGMPFREAHSIVAELARQAERAGRPLGRPDLKELRRFSDLFDEDAAAISVDTSIAARDTLGGTAPSRVEASIQAAFDELERCDA